MNHYVYLIEELEDCAFWIVESSGILLRGTRRISDLPADELDVPKELIHINFNLEMVRDNGRFAVAHLNELPIEMKPVQPSPVQIGSIRAASYTEIAISYYRSMFWFLDRNVIQDVEVSCEPDGKIRVSSLRNMLLQMIPDEESLRELAILIQCELRNLARLIAAKQDLDTDIDCATPTSTVSSSDAMTTNDRMLEVRAGNPESQRWSQRDWAENLGVSPATIGRTKCWQEIMRKRHNDRATRYEQMMQDRYSK